VTESASTSAGEEPDGRKVRAATAIAHGTTMTVRQFDTTLGMISSALRGKILR
jgi:hypothetical protein